MQIMCAQDGGQQPPILAGGPAGLAVARPIIS